MDCPACRSPLISVEYLQVEADHCADCGGVWLDAGELELLSQLTGGLDAPPESRAAGEGAEVRRRCPICRAWMEKRATVTAPPVVWDACPRGHGVWFDRNELAAVLAWGRADGAKVAEWLGGVFAAGMDAETDGAAPETGGPGNTQQGESTE